MAMTVVASGAGHYLQWGVISISLTNLMIIVSMVLVFGLALVVPFGRDDSGDERSQR